MQKVPEGRDEQLAKAHGLGNDYLVVDPQALSFPLTPGSISLLCDRHRGAGSDGLLVLSDAGEGIFGLRIFNPDGSEAEKSGNGIRIFAWWLVHTGRASRPSFSIRTAGGVVPVRVKEDHDGLPFVEANMGVPQFRRELTTLEIDGEILPVIAVSIGNPHCVVLRDELDAADLRRLGPLIEHHAAFPERTNVQLAKVENRNLVKILIWERGAGETLASGSSSCAVAAACYDSGLVDPQVTVAMPGGTLSVGIGADDSITMRGPVAPVGTFTLSENLLATLRTLA